MAPINEKKPTEASQIQADQLSVLECYYDLDQMEDDAELFDRYGDCIPDNDLDIWYPRTSDVFLEWANRHPGVMWHRTATRAEARGIAAAEQSRHRHDVPAHARSSRARRLVQARSSGRKQFPSLHRPERPSKLSREIMASELEDEGGKLALGVSDGAGSLVVPGEGAVGDTSRVLQKQSCPSAGFYPVKLAWYVHY